MRALVLGGRGAVGSGIVRELERLGHTAVAASRSSEPPIDLTGLDGLDRLARHAASYDVVINAVGIEDPQLVAAVAPTPFVDISATAGYLERLRRGARPGHSVLLGAGLAPGLSTVLVAEVPARPGDAIDLAIVLGSGEHHGPAAVAWTVGLAGRTVHEPPEGGAIVNLREHRRLPSRTGPRTYLRADFPDHHLAGTERGTAVRSYLAVGSPSTTLALRAVGRFPRLASLMNRAPHIGDARWSLTAQNRRTGVQISAQGDGQSVATAILAAHTAIALVDRRPGRAVATHEVMGLADLPELP